MIKLHNYLCTCSSCPDIFFEQIKNRILELGLSRSFMEDIVPNDLKTEYPKTYYAKYNKESYTRLRNEYNENKENVQEEMHDEEKEEKEERVEERTEEKEERRYPGRPLQGQKCCTDF